jgi:hypothetical protein
MTDAAPQYEEVQRAEGQVSTYLMAAGYFALSLVYVVEGIGQSRFSAYAAFWYFVTGLSWAFLGSLWLWRLHRGRHVTIRADEEGLAVTRGAGDRKWLRLPYPAIAGVDTMLRRWWWWKAEYGQFGRKYFAFGAKPRGAIRIQQKAERAGGTRRAVIIGTDYPEHLADLIRERVDAHGD